MIIFGDPRMQVKEAKRAIAEHQFLMGAEKALKAGDNELHLKYMKEYAEINGLKNPETNEAGIADLVKKLKPTQIILNFRKEEVEKEAERLHAQLIQDAEFEEME
jgi:lactam utilization protein B